MKAMVYDRYGPPDVIELREIDEPAPADDGVLVRVRAASVNPFDWHMLTGVPYLVRMQAGLRRPKSGALGADFAGTVETVGKDVTRFRPGDEVFGTRSGAFAEYVSVGEGRAVAPKPANVSFEHAASVGIAGVTALQGLRDKGQIRAGQKVLVNGASGGVGTFGVQIAKSFDAEVTGVCSNRNVDMVRSLGADHVLDYTREDFTRNGNRYDLILDVAGNRSWSDSKRALAGNGISVMVGGPKHNRWVGPMGLSVARRLASLPGTRTLVAPFLATIKQDDLATLAELLETGKVTPVVERTYQLSELPEALRYVGAGHARAKVVIAL
jgi:NADPH:quinone reductase-like Zn-dependent oxidoreductase